MQHHSPHAAIRRILALTALLGSVSACHAAEGIAPIQKAFPVDIPSVGSWDNVTSLAAFADAPAGRRGFVRAVDGHFEDGTGRPIRFLGGGLIRSACFPSPDMARELAARLRMLGINLVRVHHVDTSYAPKGFWDPDFPDKRHLDEGQLERFDFLFAQLKKQGVYTNINLHVSRKLTEKDGIPFARELPRMDKGVDHVIPAMIRIQKEYARDLLTHRNPYTGLPYTDDPAVAAVEINNENSLLGMALSNKLPRLPEPYETLLGKIWTDWLRNTYGKTENVRRQWKQVSAKPGPNLIKNGRFESGSEHWVLETGHLMKTQVEKTGPEGDACLRIDCLQPGPLRWSMQMHQVHLALEPHTPYTLEFAMRSAAPAKVAVVARLDHPHPETRRYEVIGLNRTVNTHDKWQTFRFTFLARNPSTGGDRVGFTFPNTPGTHWVANLSLKKGGRFGGLAPEESLENGIVQRPLKDTALPKQWEDWIACLAQTEMAYYREMRTFLVDEVGVKCPIIGTQASYGSIGGLVRETQMDYCDMHAYWQHPRFPGKPWDITNWEVDNTPLTASPSGGTLMRLASYRLADKPFVVSEFNHPNPNWYAAEAWLLTASFAAWQDWDGIVIHNYLNYSHDQWHERRWSHFFDTATRPQMAPFLPAAFMLFRQRHLKPAPRSTTLTIPESAVLPLLASGNADATALWRENLADENLPLDTRMTIRIAGEKREILRAGTDSGKAASPQIRWDRTRGPHSTYLIDTPVVKAVVGKIGGKTVDVGGIIVTMAPTPTGFAAFSVVAMDEIEIRRSERMLVSAVGRSANSGWKWSNRQNMLADFGGNPTVVEELEATIAIQSSAQGLRAYALDGKGNRKKPVELDRTKSGISLRIRPEHQAVWYEISQEKAGN